MLTPGEKDTKEEDIKEEIFYIDTNGEYKKLPDPTTDLRERKGNCFYGLSFPSLHSLLAGSRDCQRLGAV